MSTPVEDFAKTKWRQGYIVGGKFYPMLEFKTHLVTVMHEYNASTNHYIWTVCTDQGAPILSGITETETLGKRRGRAALKAVLGQQEIDALGAPWVEHQTAHSSFTTLELSKYFVAIESNDTTPAIKWVVTDNNFMIITKGECNTYREAKIVSYATLLEIANTTIMGDNKDE